MKTNNSLLDGAVYQISDSESQDADDTSSSSCESETDLFLDSDNEVPEQHPYDHDRGSNYEEPIFPTSAVTKGQALSIVMAFYLRHHLTKNAIGDLLSMLDIFIPNALPKTTYFLEKQFLNWQKNVKEHFYCTKCWEYIQEGQISCDVCHLPVDIASARQEGCFFLVSSIKELLKEMLQNRGLMNVVRKCLKRKENSGNKSEISTGDLYRTDPILKSFTSSGENLTLAFSTDGIQPFQSSNSTLWSITCYVNELDASIKSEFIVLNALWFGKSKPDFNTFMTPFVTEMKELYETGISWTGKDGTQHETKVLASICICDSPARCAVGYMKQYNGWNGCTFCLHKGETACKDGGKSSVLVFPLELPLPKNRTHADTLALAEKAVISRSPQQGVRGLTVLHQLPNFDIVKGFIPDSMHCAWLGVGVQFLNIWFASPKACFYIGNKTREIDAIMLGVRPMTEILRTPRSITLRKFYKATEHRNFVLFYSPIILADLFPLRYYRHWMLFVYAMRLLFQKQISQYEVENARALLYLFVDEIPELYGKEHVSYNVHLLVHVVDTVEQWGAPWAYSAFLPEDAGGTLTDYFHGTTHLEKQIFSHFLASNDLRSFANKHVPLANENVQDLYEKLGFSKTCRIRSQCQTLGKEQQFVLGAAEIIAIETLIGREVKCTHCILFQKMAIINLLFSTVSYDVGIKKNNSIVYIDETSGCELEKFILVNLDCNCRETNEMCFLKYYRRANAIPLFIAQKFAFKSRTVIEPNTKINITSFIKLMDTRTHKKIICGYAQALKSKCIKISNVKETCFIVNNLKFEKG